MNILKPVCLPAEVKAEAEAATERYEKALQQMIEVGYRADVWNHEKFTAALQKLIDADRTVHSAKTSRSKNDA